MKLSSILCPFSCLRSGTKKQSEPKSPLPILQVSNSPGASAPPSTSYAKPSTPPRYDDVVPPATLAKSPELTLLSSPLFNDININNHNHVPVHHHWFDSQEDLFMDCQDPNKALRLLSSMFMELQQLPTIIGSTIRIDPEGISVKTGQDTIILKS